MGKQNIIHSKETRIGACADYLLGKSFADIEYKWGAHRNAVLRWIKKSGQFKLRNNYPKSRKPKNDGLGSIPERLHPQSSRRLPNITTTINSSGVICRRLVHDGSD